MTEEAPGSIAESVASGGSSVRTQREHFILEFISAIDIPPIENKVKSDVYLQAFIGSFSEGDMAGGRMFQVQRYGITVRTPIRYDCSAAVWNCFRDLGTNPPPDSVLTVELFHYYKDSHKNDCLLGKVDIPVRALVDGEAITFPLINFKTGLEGKNPELAVTLRRTFVDRPPPLYRTFFLIRHGQSKWNRAMARISIAGMLDRDHALTTEGIKQAMALNAKWREVMLQDDCYNGMHVEAATMVPPMFDFSRMDANEELEISDDENGDGGDGSDSEGEGNTAVTSPAPPGTSAPKSGGMGIVKQFGSFFNKRGSIAGPPTADNGKAANSPYVEQYTPKGQITPQNSSERRPTLERRPSDGSMQAAASAAVSRAVSGSPVPGSVAPIQQPVLTTQRDFIYNSDSPSPSTSPPLEASAIQDGAAAVSEATQQTAASRAVEALRSESFDSMNQPDPFAEPPVAASVVVDANLFAQEGPPTPAATSPHASTSQQPAPFIVEEGLPDPFRDPIGTTNAEPLTPVPAQRGLSRLSSFASISPLSSMFGTMDGEPVVQQAPLKDSSGAGSSDSAQPPPLPRPSSFASVSPLGGMFGMVQEEGTGQQAPLTDGSSGVAQRAGGELPTTDADAFNPFTALVAEQPAPLAAFNPFEDPALVGAGSSSAADWGLGTGLPPLPSQTAALSDDGYTSESFAALGSRSRRGTVTSTEGYDPFQEHPLPSSASVDANCIAGDFTELDSVGASGTSPPRPSKQESSFNPLAEMASAAASTKSVTTINGFAVPSFDVQAPPPLPPVETLRSALTDAFAATQPSDLPAQSVPIVAQQTQGVPPFYGDVIIPHHARAPPVTPATSMDTEWMSRTPPPRGLPQVSKSQGPEPVVVERLTAASLAAAAAQGSTSTNPSGQPFDAFSPMPAAQSTRPTPGTYLPSNINPMETSFYPTQPGGDSPRSPPRTTAGTGGRQGGGGSFDLFEDFPTSPVGDLDDARTTRTNTIASHGDAGSVGGFGSGGNLNASMALELPPRRPTQTAAGIEAGGVTPPGAQEVGDNDSDTSTEIDVAPPPDDDDLPQRREEYIRLFMRADIVYASPLTRAVQTALAAMCGHTALQKNKLTLYRVIREVKRVGGFDTVGIECGAGIPKRVRTELQNSIGAAKAADLMDDVTFDTSNVELPWWTAISSFDSQREQLERVREFLTFTRYCPHAVPVFVGHSLFFRVFYAKRVSKAMSKKRPNLSAALKRFKLSNASLLAVTVKYFDLENGLADAIILDADILFGGGFHGARLARAATTQESTAQDRADNGDYVAQSDEDIDGSLQLQEDGSMQKLATSIQQAGTSGTSVLTNMISNTINELSELF